MVISKNHFVPLTGILVLLINEIRATSNLAYNKPATQSGTYSGAGCTPSGQCAASQAVDDDTTNTCAFSNNDQDGPPAWWQVDLRYQSYITSVTIQFPNTTNSEYVQGFVIIVSDSNSTNSSTAPCYTFSNGSDTGSGDTVTLRGLRPTFTFIQPLTGRYLTIRRQGGYQTRSMSFCDVQVNGIVIDSVDRAHGQQPTQSFYLYENYIAEYAVDGNNATCSIAVAYGSLASWQVDLQDSYSISSVNILPRSDQWSANYLQGFNIYVSNSSDTTNLRTTDICYSYNTTADIVPGRLLNLTCYREILGRYLTIRRTTGSYTIAITLCEVNVIGRYIAPPTTIPQCTMTTTTTTTTTTTVKPPAFKTTSTNSGGNDTRTKQASGLSPPAIIGIAVGCVLGGLLLITLLIIIILVKRRRNTKHDSSGGVAIKSDHVSADDKMSSPYTSLDPVRRMEEVSAYEKLRIQEIIKQ